MSKGFGLVLMLVSLYIGMTIYQEGLEHAFGGAFAPLESVREATASPGTQVISTSHLSDWLLWKLPELRGRLAYDVRFEIYTREDFERIVAYRGESRPDWRSIADSYEVLVLEPGQEPSSVEDFASEAGARVVYRDESVVVVARPANA